MLTVWLLYDFPTPYTPPRIRIITTTRDIPQKFMQAITILTHGTRKITMPTLCAIVSQLPVYHVEKSFKLIQALKINYLINGQTLTPFNMFMRTVN